MLLLVPKFRLRSLLCACAMMSLSLAAFCEEPPTPTAATFVYPRDIRTFRAKALRMDGLFAPDIAFAVRHCTGCTKTYVYGNFPRLRRQPWDSLSMVHEVIESNVIKKPPPRTMLKAGKHVARACPVCGQPEAGARPDRVLFCHVIPETGDDLQIEYHVKDRKFVAKKYFLVQKDKEPQEIALKDESEDSIKKAFGAYFSIRALWNETMAVHANGDRPVMIEAAPGMWLLFRPRNVSKTEFQEFCDKQTTGDAPKFTHVEPLVPADSDPNSLSDSYLEWSGDNRDVLSSGRAEGRVGIALPQLYKAASAVLASRNLAIDVIEPNDKTKGARGIISKGQVKTDINFAPLSARSAQAALTLHQASAFISPIRHSRWNRLTASAKR